MKKPISVAMFLCWTFLISYGLWAICIFGQRVMGLSGIAWFMMPFYVIGGNAPPIAAYIVRKRADPALTFKQFLQSIFDVKQKPVYYGLAILTVALYFVVPAFTGALDPNPPGLGGGAMPLYLTILAIPVFFFGGGSEEIGWRGILQPELEKKMPVLPATLLTGVIWTFWHLPLWFIAGTGQAEVDFWRFFVTVIGFSFGLAAVRRVTGSVFLCTLVHCAINSIQGTWYVLDELWIRAAITVAYAVFALVVIYAHKRLRARKLEV